MPRIRIDHSYDGTYFHGWAAQPGLRTVEGDLTHALETVLRRPVALVVAGRTDAGVHARNHVAHLDVEEPELSQLNVRRIQGILTRQYSQLWQSEGVAQQLSKLEARSGATDLVIHNFTEVDRSFDARFSALRRSYCYRIADGWGRLDPLNRTNVWWLPGQVLDIDAMALTAQRLLGEHDFLSFCRPREGATTIRSLQELTVERHDVIEIRPVADAFCHSMVRSLVGALVEVGKGRKDGLWLDTLLREPCRHHNVPVAPARGLTFEGVDYPPRDLWSQRSRETRQMREKSDGA